jgi:hypothetical protein
MAVSLLLLGFASTAQADGATRYVATTGNDTSNDCSSSSSPCATVQHAIDQADPNDEIRVSGGTYASLGTVAEITQPVTITGAFDPAYTAPNPDVYETILDAQWAGSVVSMSNASDVKLQHLAITHGDGTGSCSGTGCGGGIYSRHTNLQVTDCSIKDNVGTTSGWGYGGGLYVNDGTLNLARNHFVNNIASTSSRGHGGAVYIANLSHADLMTNTVQNNKASTSASRGDGGGIYLSQSSSVVVEGNLIENNWTSPAWLGYGGGIDIRDSDVHLSGNEIISNSTGTMAGVRPGGGVNISSQQLVTVSYNLIARNDADVYGGGVFVSRYSAPASLSLLTNNTIVDNGASGITAHRYTVMTITNNLIAGHSVGLSTLDPSYGSFFATHNLLWNASDPDPGNNAILANPLLTPHYHLYDGSPALEAGLSIPWLTADLEGKSRPQDSAYDIGAFEGAWWDISLPMVLRNY